MEPVHPKRPSVERERAFALGRLNLRKMKIG